MDLIGASHPFYKPAIRRYTIVATCFIWATVEWLFADPFWAVIATGTTGFAAYELIWTYDAKHGAKADKKDETIDGKS